MFVISFIGDSFFLCFLYLNSFSGEHVKVVKSAQQPPDELLQQSDFVAGLWECCRNNCSVDCLQVFQAPAGFGGGAGMCVCKSVLAGTAGVT